jgi:hypothetical protein
MAVKSIQELLPVISALSFGIQQFLQVVADPVASALITLGKDKLGSNLPDGSRILPGHITDVDAKKVLLGFTSILIGLLVTTAPGDDSLNIFKSIGFSVGNWDILLSALTISAGSEGVNSIVKLVQYVKDAVKEKTPSSVAQNSPAPQTPSSPVKS